MKIGGLLGSYFFFNYSVLFTTCKAFLNSFIIYQKINVLFSFFYINYTIYDIQIYLLSNIQTNKVLIKYLKSFTWLFISACGPLFTVRVTGCLNKTHSFWFF